MVLLLAANEELLLEATEEVARGKWPPRQLNEVYRTTKTWGHMGVCMGRFGFVAAKRHHADGQRDNRPNFVPLQVNPPFPS